MPFQNPTSKMNLSVLYFDSMGDYLFTKRGLQDARQTPNGWRYLRWGIG